MVLSQDADDPSLLVGRDPSQERGPLDSLVQVDVAEGLDSFSGQRLARVQAQVTADLLGDPLVVPGGDLHRDVQSVEPIDRLLGVLLGFVAEAEVAGQGEARYVGRGSLVAVGSAAIATATTRAPWSKSRSTAWESAGST